MQIESKELNFQEVNSRLKTRNIKGKPYVEVNQRVLAFREIFPQGCIVTSLVSDDGKRCLFRAEIYPIAPIGSSEYITPIATGYAFEERGASTVNKTSYIENCETSAVGRALGFLGIGITEAIASAEEVENAITQQEADTEPTDRESGVMNAKRALTDVLRRYAELTGRDFSELVTFEKGSKDYRDTQAYLFGRVRYYDAEIQRAMEHVE